jgi:molybdopterin synthase sulfur carrier subunit
MPSIRIPTPLRPYTGGQSIVPVHSATVGAALNELAERYPQLRPHLFNETGELRSFVNIFVNNEDVRYLHQGETPLREEDTIRIVPSIAGGAGETGGGERKVDHMALKVNQAFIIALLMAAYITNTPWLVAFVAAVMLIGTIWPQAALFKAVYTYVLKPAGVLKPRVIPDNPEPHLFAQGLGGRVPGPVQPGAARPEPAGCRLGAGLAGGGVGRAQPVRRLLRRMLYLLSA